MATPHICGLLLVPPEERMGRCDKKQVKSVAAAVRGGEGIHACISDLDPKMVPARQRVAQCRSLLDDVTLIIT